jgi:hypothetical protein
VTVTHCPECGFIFGGGRSLPDLRRFFALLRAAHMHWPEDHPLISSNEEQFRARLLLEAGHAHVAKAEIPAGYAESEADRNYFRAAVDGAFRSADGKALYRELRVRDASLEIITPRSISFRASQQREFNAVRDSVESIIELATGVPVEQLLREKAA